MPQTFRPLFRLDPGWPFVLAGLAILVAAILIPAQRELHDLRIEARKADLYEARTYARLMAYDRFLADLRGGEAQLVRRLAVAQLNLVPKGEEPIVLTAGLDHSVAQWIDESVPSIEDSLGPRDTDPYPDTLLARFALGPNRLWMIAMAATMVFVGLLLGSDESRAALIDRREGPDASDPPAPSSAEGGSPRGIAFDAASHEDPIDALIPDAIGARLAASAFDDEIIDVEIVEAREATSPGEGSPEVAARCMDPDPDDDVPIARDEVDGRLEGIALGDEEIVPGEPEWPHASADSGRIESISKPRAHGDSRAGGELERAFRDRVIELDTERIAPARSGAD